ncbi:asparagine--tRNA ligase [Mycoplasma parvum]|uniref:Asparagine--tRNA ligase n=1 Tax=Mycoplasma parvum str. Indiana TaxID=1403316 RepID=U5NG09_9MOLU|nr:asparagine--tRNA ligase [Mycoplasma parvum]AGX89119.1 asparaginyl-tRNA synthetase [Mycoplasma parvum str. Indiana]
MDRDSISINELLSTASDIQRKEYYVKGWIKTIQKFSTIEFLQIVDGSNLTGIQVVLDGKSLESKNISFGDAVEVRGILSPSKGGKQAFELKATHLELLSKSIDFPLIPKELSLDYLRSQQLVRHRTNLFSAIYLIRREVVKAMNDFFYENHFYPSFAPILTSNSCEGGAELFQLAPEYNEFFKKEQVLLSVSGQFYCEVISSGLGKSFSFGPTFRAEKSNSQAHLAEFWMIEVEESFSNLEKIIQTTYNLFNYLLSKVLDNCQEALQLISKVSKEKDLVGKLLKIKETKYKLINYCECIELLKKTWGDELNKEDEQTLCKLLNTKILFITNFPSNQKPFYMTRSKDKKTTFSFDMIVEGAGELAGGSEREGKIDELNSSIKKMNLNAKELEWYLQLRKYGYFSSAGFGMGFERLLMFLTGLKNIKDLSVFPRSYGGFQL